MDVLTSAADAVFCHDSEEGSGGKALNLTPSKRGREVLSEVTHTINISPEKLHNSPLQALFTAPTVKYSSTRRQIPSVITSAASSGSSKSALHSSPMMESQSPGKEKRMGRSPLTPTSNLKLLTRIASMEESFTSKKVLFNGRGISKNISENSSVLVSQVTLTRPHLKVKLQRYNSDSVSTSQANDKLGVTGGKRGLKKHCSTDDHSQVPDRVGHLAPLDEIITRPTEGSRKDKSLGLLSEKFLEHFPMEVSFLETPRRMVIDEVATALGTERRRVYDIINVLESLNMAARVQKNMYQWMGNLYLEETLGRLKAIGLKLNLKGQLQALHTSEAEGGFKIPQWIKTSWNSDGEKVDSRREKSLGILCQKFLMLLLVGPQPYLLPLDDALKMLMGDMCEDNDRLRTRGRRLYDIANVLTSLGLVQRIPLAKGFRYTGPQVEPIPIEEDTGLRLRHSLLPSCLWAGDSGGKENMTCPADHDVTPSAAPPPTQKRGRPRKLSTDFSASTIPAAKRTKLQRTYSEDTTTVKQSRKITRHPSLHEICQVAEVEREKLLQKEQQQQQQQQHQHQHQHQLKAPIIVEPIPLISRKEETRAFQKKGLLATSSTSVPTLTTILHQRHFPPQAKIPVALTFKKYGEDSSRDMHTIMPVNVVQKIPSATEVNMQKNLPQMQASNHNLKTEQGTSSAFITPGVSRDLTYWTTPTQPVNKILFKNWNQEASAIPVVSSKEPQSVPPSVIRVVTNMGEGGVKYQREPLKVFSVCSTSQTQSSSMQVTKQYVLKAGGNLEEVPSRTNASSHLPASRSHLVEGVSGFSEHEHCKSNSHTVHSVISESHVFPTSSTIPQIMVSPIAGERPLLVADCGPTSEPPVKYTWTNNMTSSGAGNPMGGHQVSGYSQLPPSNCPTSREQAKVEWQLSSDASSTDSELEEIFGDCFRFTRPKGLVARNTSQNGTPKKAL